VRRVRAPSAVHVTDSEFDRVARETVARLEDVAAAGLALLPIQRPIPVRIGGSSEPAYRRVGRLADGWFPMVRPGPDLDAALDRAWARLQSM
jgi:alkanesulfonate monooxygenase SsuD/methylene tetrahydromethanopterin reductase-like flavin-dependent oxidoreductase (luciferase family)